MPERFAEPVRRAKAIAAVIADAADEEAATESTEGDDEAAAAWLLDNCDVDIDG